MSRPLAYIIEDQFALSELYGDALRLVGYDVKQQRTGLDAVNALELEKTVPALIVLDMNLPQVSGQDVRRYIRKKKQLEAVPILIVTANSVIANSIKQDLGDNDYLFIKPVSMGQLQTLAKQFKPQAPPPEWTMRTQEVETIDLSADAHNQQVIEEAQQREGKTASSAEDRP